MRGGLVIGRVRPSAVFDVDCLSVRNRRVAVIRVGTLGGSDRPWRAIHRSRW